MTIEQQQALSRFVAALRSTYGNRLHDVVLFGSRARGDARPDSDADVAVVLEDETWRFWPEMRVLADLAYEALIETGLNIQPWPVPRSTWDDPAAHDNRLFVEAMKRDGKGLLIAA